MAAISVIIPTFNMRRQLARCLDMLSHQPMKPDEVLIVDDGSSDGTQDLVGARLIAPVQDSKLPVRYIRQEHAGASAARNRGFAASQGEYVMFLDADVVLKKHAIERLFKALEKSDSTCHPGAERSGAIGSPGESIASLQNDKMKVAYAYSSFRWGWKKFSSFPFDGERLKQMPYIHTTSLIRREILPVKPFDESLKRLQDWDLYLSLLERGWGGIFIPEVLFTVETRGTMSRWLPSIMYQIPFGKLGIKIERMEKYREAEQIVRMKHGLHLSRSSS